MKLYKKLYSNEMDKMIVNISDLAVQATFCKDEKVREKMIEHIDNMWQILHSKKYIAEEEDETNS